MSNRQIRRDAWGLFRANYLGILAGVAVVEGIVLFVYLAPALLALGYAAVSLVSLIGWILLSPVTVAGTASFFLGIIDGGSPNLRLLFSHVGGFQRIRKIWAAVLSYLCMAFCYVLIITAIRLLVNLWGGPFRLEWIMTALFFALGLAGLWATFRFGLLAYLMAKEPDAKVSEWLRASWRVMRRNGGRLVRLMLSLLWPPLPVSLFINVQIRLMREAGTLDPHSVIPSLLPGSIMRLLMCFYAGYVILAFMIFARDLLHARREIAGQE